MKHTPGPWQLAQDGSLGSIESVSGRVPIGHSFQTRPTRRPEDHNERIANARLMAAAPELLEALQLLLEQDDNGEDEIWVRKKARAAIAKATGEQT